MSRAKQPLRPREHPTTRRTAGRWAAFLFAPAIVVGIVVVSTFADSDQNGPAAAIPFELSSTAGQTVSLSQALAGGDALLYFSMGVGCDGCFLQIPELEDAIRARGLTLLPIMVDPAPVVAYEASRFGIELPILIDPGARVSAAYGMLGIYGHGDRPSHSFALVRQSGDIAWVRHYAEMFVPADVLLGEIDAAVGT